MAGLKRKYSEVRDTYESLTMSRTYKLQEYDRRVEEFKAAKRQRERMQAFSRHDEKELKWVAYLHFEIYGRTDYDLWSF